MSSFSVDTAIAIYERACQPARDTVEEQIALLIKKIKIASTLKMRKIRYEVIAHYSSPHFDGDLAMTVARRVKRMGFTVKKRENELKIEW